MKKSLKLLSQTELFSNNIRVYKALNSRLWSRVKVISHRITIIMRVKNDTINLILINLINSKYEKKYESIRVKI